MESDEIKQKIEKLKKSLSAVIVAHNYQRPEVQDIADITGDSLELARQCTQVDAEVIVFCGVHFMAESAAILSPERTVLLSEADAGCPMADMIGEADLREWKERYPEAAVVCYVNSSAAVKALSDVCCTSANGLGVVQSLPNDEVLFIPDRHLGHYVSTKTDKRMILYPGFCPPHQRLIPRHIEHAKELHPDAVVLVHPECSAEVIARADAALSTSQMIRYVKESDARTFLIGTEEGLLHGLRRENPEKAFHLLTTGLLCPDMKKTTLKSVMRTMEERRNVVRVAEEVRVKAKLALDRMLEVT
ncbi:MAG TPA: quinolinate synthase NadA [Dehalococcoidia bacterium]|nr:quinolinate synthase NadA [Dehalococcoidia bacterium]